LPRLKTSTTKTPAKSTSPAWAKPNGSTSKKRSLLWRSKTLHTQSN
jgi:hypothetical protein